MRLAVFSILLLTAATARAKCVSPCSCFEPSAWVVSGAVESVSDDEG